MKSSRSSGSIAPQATPAQRRPLRDAPAGRGRQRARGLGEALETGEEGVAVAVVQRGERRVEAVTVQDRVGRHPAGALGGEQQARVAPRGRAPRRPPGGALRRVDGVHDGPAARRPREPPDAAIAAGAGVGPEGRRHPAVRAREIAQKLDESPDRLAARFAGAGRSTA
jgi:hypothetical protein